MTQDLAIDSRWDGAVAEALFENQHEFHTGEWEPDEWPRKPSAYTATEHFVKAKTRDKRRHITGDRIRECIEEGELLPARGTAAFFSKEFSGVAFYLVVGREEESSGLYALTMWPWVKSRGEAITSQKWLATEVIEMKELNNEMLRRVI